LAVTRRYQAGDAVTWLGASGPSGGMVREAAACLHGAPVAAGYAEMAQGAHLIQGIDGSDGAKRHADLAPARVDPGVAMDGGAAHNRVHETPIRHPNVRVRSRLAPPVAR
jgi:hypothetical protein